MNSGPFRALVLLAFVATASCHRRRAWVVLTRREGTRDVTYLAEPVGTRPPVAMLRELPGDVHSGVAIDAGRALLAVVFLTSDSTRAELWRIRFDGSLHAERRLAEMPAMFLLAASTDGRAALMDDDRTPNRRSVVAFRAGREPSMVTLGTVRYLSGADVSADGRRALFSGVPTSCTEMSLGRCPIETYGADLSTDPPTIHRVAADTRAHYQPQFVPGTHDERVLYQSTAFDFSPACASDLNLCRHDLVTRDWLGQQAPQLVRTAAVGGTFSPGGTRLSFVAYAEPETGCSALPCRHQSLWVETVGRNDARRIATADVTIFTHRFWSADDHWLAYLSGSESSPRLLIKTIGADGTQGRSLEGRIIAWVTR